MTEPDPKAPEPTEPAAETESKSHRNLRRLVPVIALVVVALVSGYAFLRPGHPTSPDVWSHLVRQEIVYESLNQGNSPFYSFMFYSGYPHLRFYSPLLAFLGGLLMLGTRGNPVPALKILLFLLHIVSAWTMFVFLRRRTGSAWGAALGSLVYLVIPWRVMNIAVIANSPQGLVYPLLPLLFLALDRVVERPNLKHSAFLALWVGLMVTAHLVYAVFAIMFLLIVLLFRIGNRSTEPAANPRVRLPGFLAGAGLGAVCLSAFFLIPFAVEYTRFLFPHPRVELPTPHLAVLLNPWSRPGGYAGTYLGVSVVVLVTASIVVLLLSRKQRRSQAAILTGLVVSLALVFFVPRLGRVGAFLTAGLPGVRSLAFVVFFAGVLLGSGGSWLEQKLGRYPVWRTVVFLVLFAVIALDCLPHLLRIGYSTQKRFLNVRAEVYEALSEQNPGKVLDLHNHIDQIDDFRRLACFPASGFLYGGLSTPCGPAYYQFAPRSMLYVYPLVNMIAADLGDSTNLELTAAAMKALALMGVTHLITLPTLVGAKDNTTYVVLKQGIDWDTRFLSSDWKPPLVFGPTGAGLVLASGVVRPVARENIVQVCNLQIADDWQGLLDAVEIEFDNNHISFIPAMEDQAGESLACRPGVRVLDSETRHHQVLIKLQTTDDCFLRLALSYYPELRVTLDDRPVRFSETKDHFMYLKCPAGTHTIRVTAPLNLLRKLMLVLSGLAFCACIVALSIPTRPRRKTTT